MQVLWYKYHSTAFERKHTGEAGYFLTEKKKKKVFF